jgi:uncharacterized Fe-S cluster protein YjdI
MSESEKAYTNGEITVLWKPGVCVHSGRCVQGLGEVFNVSARPWINMEGGKNRAHHPAGGAMSVRRAQLCSQ